MEELTTILQDMKITESTTRSAAKRNVPADTPHRCIICFYEFEGPQMKEHLKTKHRAQSKEITKEFKEMREILNKDPGNAMNKRNYKLALAKVTLLKKYSALN